MNTIREPHFDDERTLRSAKRVVPLSSVKRREKARTALHVAYGLFFSALLGAMVALLTSNFELKSNAEDAGINNPGTAMQSVQPSQAAVAENVANDVNSLEVPSAIEANESLPSQTRSQPSVIAHARKPTPVPSISTVAEVATDVNDNLNLRPNQHWEEHRLRRVMQRETQRERPQNNNGLFRVPEIFEGKQPQ